MIGKKKKKKAFFFTIYGFAISVVNPFNSHVHSLKIKQKNANSWILKEHMLLLKQNLLSKRSDENIPIISNVHRLKSA